MPGTPNCLRILLEHLPYGLLGHDLAPTRSPRFTGRNTGPPASTAAGDIVSVLLLFPDASDDLRFDVTIDGRFIDMDFGRGLEVRGGQQVEEQRTSTQNHRSGEPPI